MDGLNTVQPSKGVGVIVGEEGVIALYKHFKCLTTGSSTVEKRFRSDLRYDIQWIPLLNL